MKPLIVLCWSAVILSGCTEAQGALCTSRYHSPTRTSLNSTSSEAQKTITRGIVMLALQLDFILSQTSMKDANIVFAPVNIVKTLGTVMLGAAGDTERELALVLGMAVGRKLSHNVASMHRELGYLLKQLITENPGVKFGSNINIASGVFIQKGAKVCESYIRLTKDIYRTEVYALDFYRDGSKAATAVNQWVANKTMSRITNIVDSPVSRDTKVLIAGALYFNGDWEVPFVRSHTRWQPFYLGSDGRFSKDSILVQMMVNEAAVPYYVDNLLGYEAIGLPYKKRDVMMFIILPSMHINLRNLTYRLNYIDIENIVKRSSVQELLYVVPKMKITTRIDLRGPLESIGVKTLFNPSRANFSNLADGVYADEILHQVELDVNEIGTTAAAATAVTINRSGYNAFRVDRPFIFFIYNVKVDVLTFWGSIQKPTPFATK